MTVRIVVLAACAALAVTASPAVGGPNIAGKVKTALKLSKQANAKADAALARAMTPGPAGPHGSKGEPGLTGLTGTDGKNGEPGRDGGSGSSGTDGATGPVGPQGEPGVQGETGPQGPQGETGPAGSAGSLDYSTAKNSSTITVEQVDTVVASTTFTVDQPGTVIGIASLEVEATSSGTNSSRCEAGVDSFTEVGQSTLTSNMQQSMSLHTPAFVNTGTHTFTVRCKRTLTTPVVVVNSGRARVTVLHG